MNEVLTYLDSVFTEPIDAVTDHEVINQDSAVGRFIHQGHVYDFCYRKDGEIVWTENVERTNYLQDSARGYLLAKGVGVDGLSRFDSYGALQGYLSYRADKGSPPRGNRCGQGKVEVRNPKVKGGFYCRSLEKGNGSPLKANEAIKTGRKKSTLAGDLGMTALLGTVAAATLDPDARKAIGGTAGAVKEGVSSAIGDVSKTGKEVIGNLQKAKEANAKMADKNKELIANGKQPFDFNPHAETLNKDLMNATDKKVKQTLSSMKDKIVSEAKGYIEKKGQQANELGQKVKSLFEKPKSKPDTGPRMIEIEDDTPSETKKTKSEKKKATKPKNEIKDPWNDDEWNDDETKDPSVKGWEDGRKAGEQMRSQLQKSQENREKYAGSKQPLLPPAQEAKKQSSTNGRRKRRNPFISSKNEGTGITQKKIQGRGISSKK